MLITGVITLTLSTPTTVMQNSEILDRTSLLFLGNSDITVGSVVNDRFFPAAIGCSTAPMMCLLDGIGENKASSG